MQESTTPSTQCQHHPSASRHSLRIMDEFAESGSAHKQPQSLARPARRHEVSPAAKLGHQQNRRYSCFHWSALVARMAQPQRQQTDELAFDDGSDAKAGQDGHCPEQVANPSFGSCKFECAVQARLPQKRDRVSPELVQGVAGNSQPSS